jgi:archaellum component FlaC
VSVIEEEMAMEASPTDKRIDDLSGRVGRFEVNVDRRFERFEDKVEDRFDKVDQKFERFEGAVKDGFDKVDERFERFEDKIDARFARWDKIVTAVGVSIAGGVVSIAGTVVYKVLGL